jgi:hypothetical protein
MLSPFLALVARRKPDLSNGSGSGVRRAARNRMHESQQIATEHRDLAAHAHRSGAEHHGKEVHLTGHESSRESQEHSRQTYLRAQNEHIEEAGNEHLNAHKIKEQEIAALAYRLWQGRGCPEGSPEEDWHRAVEELRARR